MLNNVVSLLGTGISAPANNYISIATAIVTSGGSGGAITFSSIPQTYTHLQLRIFEFESTTGINPKITFNGDTAANYSWHAIYGNGASAATYAGTSYGGIIMDQVQSTTLPNVSVVDILDYTNTNKYKTVKFLQGYDKNGSGQIGLWSGSWRSTSAITSLTIQDPTFAQYSSFALYGVK